MSSGVKMKITVERLRQIIREELELVKEEDVAATVKSWLDDRKPTTDVSRKKAASELAKKLASSGKGRADIDTAIKAVRKDIHAAKDTDQSKQDKLAALGAALDDPETTASFSTASKTKLPPLV